MATKSFLGGPYIKYRFTKPNEEHFQFDLSDCTQEERSVFIYELLTEHHNKGIIIDVNMKEIPLEADVSVCWNDGCERFAQKVIKRIESLSTSK